MNELHLAAYHANLAAVAALLAQGADPNEVDASGYTPLLWCAFRGLVGEQGPVAQALLAAGADPNACTASGDATVLILAVQSSSVPVVEALISCGANVNGPADDVTPLMVAARTGDENMIDILLRHGANVTLKAGNYDAADYAAHGGHPDLAARIRATKKV